MARTFERLLILGLDGATWTVLDPMRQRGLMPNLDALLGRSAHGTLRSIVPPVTSAAWTSMMTGCGPARHGVFDHRYYDTAAGQMKVNHSGRVRVPTFWHIISQAGRPVVSLNVPATYPPLKVRGVVVSGMDAPHLDAALSGAPEFARRLRAEVPNYSLRYFWKRAPLSLDELARNARLTAESFRGRAEGGLLADQMVPDWAALMVQFQNLDPFQHRAWRYLNVDETGIDDAPWNAAAGSVLRGLDEAIGLLIEMADRRGAGILVVSDHGFGPCLGRIHVNRILVDAGVARLPGLAGRLKRRARQAVDHVRLWGAKRDDPHARAASFDTSVVAQFPFDWNRTHAFAPHQDTAAMIYLNSTARRAGAPLTTPRQIDEARAEAAGALGRACHPETGAALFPQVIATAEAYALDPAREGYPDLIALPDESYWVRTKLAAGTAWVEPDPNLPGTHRPEGIVALAGAGITPGRALEANLTDIAPTVLRLLGLPVPATMEGMPLACASALPTTRQDPAGPALNGPHQAAFEYTPEEQAIIEKRLSELGYLE
jgi:predicted AlkP superfamily phosphohydrolase/phosphomutase